MLSWVSMAVFASRMKRRLRQGAKLIVIDPRRTELARYLPPVVLDWMVQHGRAWQPEPGREDRDPTAADAQALGLLELPPPRHFPVILAARMSLSFPLLFAALPLWAIDHDQVGRAPLRRCWFSDGGISSNFPMHLFDGLVPSWPTFGINLEDEIPGRPDTYLPEAYDTGYGERWNRFDQEGVDGAARFGGFFSAILGAMQNWNDNALSRMPGVRDRIARVRLKPTEGGLNLNMEGDVIQAVAERAEALIAEDPKNPNAHYWMAYALGRYSQGISVAKALAQGLGGKVKASLEMAIRLQPRHADAHIALGAFHAEVIDKVGKLLGRTQGADAATGLKMFQQALKLNPGSAIGMVEYANGLVMLEGDKRMKEAEKLYAQAAACTAADAMERLDIEMAKSELED